MSQSTKPKPEVTIGMPAYGHVPALCCLSFGAFIAHGVAAGYVTSLSNYVGAYIDRARNDIVKSALAKGSTHLMFVDQDMILPENALARLIEHDKPVVGGLYFGKDELFTPVAFSMDPWERCYDLKDDPMEPTDGKLPEGVTCVCGVSEDHLHEVGCVGMGCTLIETQVFRDMSKHYSDEKWFSSKDTGEDVHFALRCKDMGVPIYLDGFLNCGHVRDQLVTREHYEWQKTYREEHRG